MIFTDQFPSFRNSLTKFSTAKSNPKNMKITLYPIYPGKGLKFLPTQNLIIDIAQEVTANEPNNITVYNI